MADNIIRPKQKRVWGFSGTAAEIKMTDEKAKDAEDILDTGGTIDPNAKGAQDNGGGESGQFPGEDDVTKEYLESLTKDQLLALAAHHEVELEKPKGNKTEVLGELKEYYEV